MSAKVFLLNAMERNLAVPVFLDSVTLFFFQMCITGGLGIPGSRKDRTTLRNVLVSLYKF